MTKRRHIPYRTCLGCRRRQPKHDLVRLAADSTGVLLLDSGRQLPGRGAYVCPNADCLAEALKKHAFLRTLRAPVRADAERLKIELEQWLISKK